MQGHIAIFLLIMLNFHCFIAVYLPDIITYLYIRKVHARLLMRVKCVINIEYLFASHKIYIKIEYTVHEYIHYMYIL